MVFHGSLPGLRMGTNPAPSPRATAPPGMNPRASIAVTTSGGRSAQWLHTFSTMPLNMTLSASKGVMSLKTIPGCGKSGTSRINLRRCSSVRFIRLDGSIPGSARDRPRARPPAASPGACGRGRRPAAAAWDRRSAGGGARWRSMIRHRKRLRRSLRLVVAAAGPDRVDVAPVRLRLGMDERIAVDLGGRSEQEGRAFRTSKTEHVHGPDCADLQGVAGVRVILRRRGRRREVEDVAHVSFDVDTLVDVRLAELEIGILDECAHVVEGASDEVVERQHAQTPRQQGLAKVRADEAGATRDDRPFLLASRGQYLDM